MIRPVALSCFNGAEKKNDTNTKTQAEFIYTKFLEELRQKVPVAQVLKEIERCSKPEQTGLSTSSSIRLEIVCI